MDIKNTQEWSTRRIREYNKTEANKYDYETEGILRKCLPKILFKGNPILVTFLQLIDMRLILLIGYIKRLQHFKHISIY